MKTTKVNIRDEEYDVYTGKAGRGKNGYSGDPFPSPDQSAGGPTLEKYKEYSYERILVMGIS